MGTPITNYFCRELTVTFIVKCTLIIENLNSLTYLDIFHLFLADIFKGPCKKITDLGHCQFRVRF